MKIIIAQTYFARLKGLLGTRLDDMAFDGMLIMPCKSVHTFGMRYPLDIYFLDQRGAVLMRYLGVRPGRLCRGPLKSHAVLEIPHRAVIADPEAFSNHIKDCVRSISKSKERLKEG
jgi:uncharacterized membrane protein (UPF0127 family)